MDDIKEAAYRVFSVWYDPAKKEEQRRKSWDALGKSGQEIWIKCAEEARR